MPESAPSAGIESVCVVGGGDEHYAVYDDRRDLQDSGCVTMKDPFRAKLRDIRRGDLRQIDEATAAVVAVVAEPVAVESLIDEVGCTNVDRRDGNAVVRSGGAESEQCKDQSTANERIHADAPLGGLASVSSRTPRSVPLRSMR